MMRVVVFVLTVITAYAQTYDVASRSFNWSSLLAYPSLQYKSCYNGFQCAKLQVPQDWNNPDDGESASIAIIKLPASMPDTHTRHGGTILTNPGGPGGSGVADLLTHGRYLKSIVDGEREYDVVSFDPRGIFRSEPSAACFDSAFARQVFDIQARDLGFLDDGLAILKRQLALARSFGQICEDGNTDALLRQRKSRAHMSTAVVARDMLQIIDQIEVLRRQRFDREITPTSSQGHTTLSTRAAKLQYIGFSYGTQLGHTFASMFPTRVKSMVLDGVVDSYDYSGGMWIRNLLDTETSVMNFYNACLEAGERCALRSAHDSSGADIKTRVDTFLNKINKLPIGLISEGYSQVLTAQDVRQLFLIPMLMPVKYFEQLSNTLAAVLQGNYTDLRDTPPGPELCESHNGSREDNDYFWGYEAAHTYICNDGEDLSNVTSAEMENYISQLQELSPTFGAYWARFGVTCSGWNTRPAWRFAGPYGRNLSVPLTDISSSVPGIDCGQQTLSTWTAEGPSHPILFLSSRVDPVTPLRNAMAMSALNPGSSVVIQESVGHCAVYSSPSDCTKRIVEAYLANGTMPKNGATCLPDCRPFESSERCQDFQPDSLHRAPLGLWRW